MSVTKTSTQDRRLSVVTDPDGIRADVAAVQRGLENVTRLIRHQYGVDDLLAPEVLEHLADLDAEAATAADVFELEHAAVEAARKELSEAARRLADAEERWARAGIVADETNRAVIAAREAGGLVLTASGYRRRP